MSQPVPNDKTRGEPVRHRLRIRVTPDDIDTLGHVNNVRYLQWVQDIAADRWAAVATPEERAGVVWVAVRHEIDYEAPAFSDDEIEARTWVQSWSGVTSERRTEIVRTKDETVLAQARSVWCAVDPDSLRPRRVDAALKARFARG